MRASFTRLPGFTSEGRGQERNGVRLLQLAKQRLLESDAEGCGVVAYGRAKRLNHRRIVQEPRGPRDRC